MSRRLTVRLSKSLSDRLLFYSEQQGMSQNDVLNHALRFYLDVKEGRSLYDSFGEDRMNQMVELLIGLQGRLDTMTLENREFMDMMLRMTSGDNYLTD